MCLFYFFRKYVLSRWAIKRSHSVRFLCYFLHFQSSFLLRSRSSIHTVARFVRSGLFYLFRLVYLLRFTSPELRRKKQTPLYYLADALSSFGALGGTASPDFFISLAYYGLRSPSVATS